MDILEENNRDDVNITKTNHRESIGHFINYVRVATALAIIKAKPKGSNTLQHARAVCAQYMCHQSAWREKAISLEDKILDLEQQLLQKKMLLAQNTGDVDSEIVYPTPPCSSDPIQEESQDKAVKPLSKHTQFLSSVITLRSLPNDYTLTINDEKIREVTLKTVKKCLCIIKSWLCDPELQSLLSDRMIGHSVGVILRLVDNRPQVIQEQVTKEVCSVVEGVIVEMVKSSSLNNWIWQDKLQQIVLHFAESPAMYNNIATLLVECIQRYAELLRHTKMKNKTTTIDHCMFENIYYIFSCLEKVINYGAKKQLSLRDCTALRSQLEDSLLHISDFMPLFSLYVWQINSLLENLNTLSSGR